jgi:hypothetical protein
MANDDKQQLTNADQRDAFWQGCAYREANGPHATPVAEAMRRWPDPRPTVMVQGHRVRLTEDGAGFEHFPWGDAHCIPTKVTIADVRALASLLPREPVTITEEMVFRARRRYEDAANTPTSLAGIRAAVAAVAADLAGKGER